MSLVPNITYSAPGQPLFAPAAAAGGGGVIPADLIVSTLKAVPYASDDVISYLAVTNDGEGGVAFIGTSVAANASLFLTSVSTLNAPVPLSRGALTASSNAVQLTTQFSNGAGGLLAPGLALLMNENGNMTMSQLNSQTNITVGNSQVTISADTQMALTSGTGQITINGALMPGSVMSTPTVLQTINLGANQIIPFTSTFTAPPGEELRLAWNDVTRVTEGSPSLSQSVAWYILANGNYLRLDSILADAVVAESSTICAHNLTWMPYGAGEAELCVGNIGAISSVVQLIPGQDVRLQNLGPVVPYT